MNKAEFKAIKMIAEKLNWKTVNFNTIKQMVKNQQALELDTVGECDGDEETLLSIALWDADHIRSTKVVSDYCSLQEWHWNLFCEDMGITNEEMNAMMHWHNIKAGILAEEYEQEDMAMEEALQDEYYYEIMRDVAWITKHC